MENTSTPPPPPPRIKILPNAGQKQGKGLEEPVAHTHQIYYGEYLHPTPSPPHIKILPHSGQDKTKGLERQWHIPTKSPPPSEEVP